jgi:hypothetical protein
MVTSAGYRVGSGRRAGQPVAGHAALERIALHRQPGVFLAQTGQLRPPVLTQRAVTLATQGQPRRG